MSRTNPDDTIAAVATPPGEGGIGIVRVSGDDAILYVDAIFTSSRGRDIRRRPGRVFHGEIRDGDQPIDEVLVHLMRAPHSYTREDVVEINCHGGPGPLNAVLELVLREGARLAGPGEFTWRAFINGRIDLVQAEAVIDRIRAQTKAGLQSASAASRGLLSKTIIEIRDDLVAAKAHVEAAIDFPDQDLPDLITPELRRRLSSAQERMKALQATADAGCLLREGASIAICGRPNVGKSSLFNAMLRDSRAIVTSQPGTTRDMLQETVTLEGIPVRLMDTAGLRHTEDEVERIGVEVARRAITEAAVILFLVDASMAVHPEDRILLEELRAAGVPIVLVANKIDLGETIEVSDFNDEFAFISRVSALNASGVEDLETSLASLLRGGARIAPDQALVTRVHQKDSLRRANEAVQRVEANFKNSPEFMAIELDDAIRALGEITGETTPDDVLEYIFGSFCIGK